MTSTLSTKERQRVALALIASGLLHVVLIVLFVISTWFKLPAPRMTLPEPKPLEVTIFNRALPTPTPLVVTVVKQSPPPEKVTRSVLSSDGIKPSATAPKNPAFESDVNSIAASEQPGKGREPLPSQEGKERPFMQFETKRNTEGTAPQPAAAPESTPVGVTKVEPRSTPAPEARFQPTPIPREQLPKPAPVTKPDPNVVPIRRATPTPQPTAQPQQLARLNQQRPQSPAKSGYQPQTESTKIEGGISNRGKSGVDAVSTPLGRYRKVLGDAIGSRWYHYVNQRMDLIAIGDVHIRFYVNRDGRVESLRILSNSANDSFGTFCVQAVNEAKIPPIPPEVFPKLEDGRLEIEYTFTIYPQ